MKRMATFTINAKKKLQADCMYRILHVRHVGTLELASADQNSVGPHVFAVAYKIGISTERMILSFV
jgi:hypothetical protein